MRAGRLDRRITIESATTTQNEYGETVETWSSFAANIPATVTPLRGRELFAAQQVVATSELKVQIRYMAGITEAMRVVYDGVTYGIQHVAEIGRRAGIELLIGKPN
jgi:SPP1 family predicted phage head-tail adaptor